MKLSWLPLLLCLSIAGCTSMPPLQDSMAEFRTRQEVAARTAEEEGRMADALALWQSLTIAGDNDPEVTRKISDLDSRINQDVKRRLQNGTAAYDRGDHSGGDLWMLRVLALQPANEQARRLLVDSNSLQAEAQQRDKSDTENQIAETRLREAPGGIDYQLHQLYDSGQYTAVIEAGSTLESPEDEETGALLRSAHLKLAEQAEQSGNREEALSHVQAALAVHPLPNDPLLDRVASLQGSLSEQWYKEGARTMKTDLPTAIDALEKSLEYNPYNSAAKRKLAQAHTLQRNLERIQNQP